MLYCVLLALDHEQSFYCKCPFTSIAWLPYIDYTSLVVITQKIIIILKNFPWTIVAYIVRKECCYITYSTYKVIQMITTIQSTCKLFCIVAFYAGKVMHRNVYSIKNHWQVNNRIPNYFKVQIKCFILTFHKWFLPRQYLSKSCLIATTFCIILHWF